MCVVCVGPPSVEVLPGAAVTVDVNGNLTLDCHASGRPEPTVTWMRTVSPLTFISPLLPPPHEARSPCQN